MKIKLTSVYVDDQEKALRFYTKKSDFSRGCSENLPWSPRCKLLVSEYRRLSSKPFGKHVLAEQRTGRTLLTSHKPVCG